MNNKHLADLWHICGMLKGYAEAIALIETQLDLTPIHAAFVECSGRLEKITNEIQSVSGGFIAPGYMVKG